MMKGIILAAGKGTRLYPATLPVCKPLVPVYDKPLIYYPLTNLMQAGIKDILIIVPPGDRSKFEKMFGDGSSIGIHIEYTEQKKQRGIADALIIGADFIGNDNVCLILGDNIFYGTGFRQKLRQAVKGLTDGAEIFGYYVEDPRPFGVVEFDEDGSAVSLEEKPKRPRSNYIVPGLYFYDNTVIDIAKRVKPSARNELEITSVNKTYLVQGRLNVITLCDETTWFDAGSADSLYRAACSIRAAQKSGTVIGCPEETSFRNHWITADELKKSADRLQKTKYGLYLNSVYSEAIDND